MKTILLISITLLTSCASVNYTANDMKNMGNKCVNHQGVRSFEHTAKDTMIVTCNDGVKKVMKAQR